MKGTRSEKLVRWLNGDMTLIRRPIRLLPNVKINTKIWKIDSSPITDEEIKECYEDHRNRRDS